MAKNIVQFRIPLLSQLNLCWHWWKLLMIWGREKSVYVQNPCKVKRNCALILLIPCTMLNPPFFLTFFSNFHHNEVKIDFWSWTLVFKMWFPIRSDVTLFPFETCKDFTDFNLHVTFHSSTQLSKISTTSLRDLSDGGEKKSREKRELYRREKKTYDHFFGLKISMKYNK